MDNVEDPIPERQLACIAEHHAELVWIGWLRAAILMAVVQKRDLEAMFLQVFSRKQVPVGELATDVKAGPVSAKHRLIISLIAALRLRRRREPNELGSELTRHDNSPVSVSISD
jgi:hypothetical protein